jgi:hypothetical protein
MVQLVNATCVPDSEDVGQAPGVLRFVPADWDFFIDPVAVLLVYAATSALGPIFVALPVSKLNLS